MGIPTFFRSLIQKTPDILHGCLHSPVRFDGLYIDFNSLIYVAYASCSNKKSEEDIRKKLWDMLRHLVNDIVRPQKFLFLSFDGTAPRAKMVQQRSRRYKSVQRNSWISINNDDKDESPWDPSSNIAPGTSFMDKVTQELKQLIRKRMFGNKIDVFLSDVYDPGEGEHKFLHHLRHLSGYENKIGIYSPDGDMISLSMWTKQPHLYIIRIPDTNSEQEKKYQDHPYLYCDLDKLKQHLCESVLPGTYRVNEKISDYNFLLALVGNDFVPSLPFMKIRNQGLSRLLRLYEKISLKYPSQPLLSATTTQQHSAECQVNMPFFLDLVQELARLEQREMQRELENIYRECEKPYVRSPDKTDTQVFLEKSEHLPLFHPDNPLSTLYTSELNRIDYSLPKHLCKEQYYHYFWGLGSETRLSLPEYNQRRTDMVLNYLESIMFTLRYYTKGCPSWKWHYRYRVAPFFSDVQTVIQRYSLNMNHLRFSQGTPYAPFEQLLLILPLSMKSLLPEGVSVLMDQHAKYYPLEFRVDALAGKKYIYSEAILAEFENEESLLSQIPNRFRNHPRNILYPTFWFLPKKS